MPDVNAVVFDMDGLMFNTEDVYTQVGTELMRRRGRDFTSGLKDAMMGLTPRAAFEEMVRWHHLTETWQDLLTESNEIFLGLLGGQLRPMPGLFELLDALEGAVIPKAIATSSDRDLAEACLTPFRLRRRFEFILTASDVTHGKPHPEIYLAAARQFGVPPHQMLVLEDSQNGCRSAAAAGARVVAVPGDHSRGHDFGAAWLVVDSLADPRLYDVLGIAVP